MSPARFLEALARLGLSRAEAAQFFGVNLRTIHYWAAGTVGVPQWAEKLLTIFLNKPRKLDVRDWMG